MNDFGFKLTPAYCLYNGVAVLQQEGTYIKFLIENEADELLKARLKRSFENHIEMITKNKNCPEKYRRIIDVHFEGGSRNRLRKCVLELYKADSQGIQKAAEEEKEQGAKEAAAVLLLDTIITEARNKRATDIHIEENSIRFRINGRLEKEMEIQKEKSQELIQRIKLLSGMNVIEKRKSQDGHFIYGNKNPLFLRVSSMSVIGSLGEGEESLVMRLLDTKRVPLMLGQLGYNGKQLEQIELMSDKKNGLVLVCGPTGSGKSTTLASILVEIEKKDNGYKKIVSLEDPPEYRIPNVTQIKIDENNSFNDSLSHIFRQDPDVIMIGEIRDEESAAVALRAALTGHLVFATLHTASAGEAFLRLENLGVDRALLSSVMRGVICQELNYIEGKMRLYADVGVWGRQADCGEGVAHTQGGAVISSNATAEEINGLFTHYTNYSDILDETMQLYAKKLKKAKMAAAGSSSKLPYIKGKGARYGRIHERAV